MHEGNWLNLIPQELQLSQWDGHKKARHTDTAGSLPWFKMECTTKIEYKIRKEKRKSVLIEVYSNKLKTEPSKDYLQL